MLIVKILEFFDAVVYFRGSEKRIRLVFQRRDRFRSDERDRLLSRDRRLSRDLDLWHGIGHFSKSRKLVKLVYIFIVKTWP